MNNSADYTGGGFFASGSSHGMQDLQFTQNSANNGGALAAIHTYFSSFLRVNIAYEHFFLSFSFFQKTFALSFY